MLKNDAKYQDNWPQRLPNRFMRAPKSTSGLSEAPFWGNTAAKTAQKELCPNILVPKVWFWLAFWSPKPLQIETKMRKMRRGKTTWLLHRFFHGSGMVLRSFFCFFWRGKFAEACQVIRQKSLQNIGHGDKIKGRPFWNFSEQLKILRKLSLFVDFILGTLLEGF